MGRKFTRADRTAQRIFRRKIMEQIGATGNFPNGKLSETDEGEIAIAVIALPEQGTVIINFGKEVSWIGMNADQADGLAELLKQKADELRKTLC